MVNGRLARQGTMADLVRLPAFGPPPEPPQARRGRGDREDLLQWNPAYMEKRFGFRNLMHVGDL